MTHLIHVIAAINLFYAGFCLGESDGFNTRWTDNLATFLAILTYLLFGILFLIFNGCVILRNFLREHVYRGLHIKFIWTYFILKKPFTDFSTEKLQAVMTKARNLNPKWWQLGDKIYIRLAAWINHKHNTKG